MNFRDVIRYIITTSNGQTKHELETKVALRSVLGMHSNEYTQRRFDLLIVLTDKNRWCSAEYENKTKQFCCVYKTLRLI